MEFFVARIMFIDPADGIDTYNEVIAPIVAYGQDIFSEFNGNDITVKWDDVTVLYRGTLDECLEYFEDIGGGYTQDDIDNFRSAYNE